MALVNALKTVKGLLKDDGVKTSVESIAPQLLTLFDNDSDDEVTKAKNGLPSGSAPRRETGEVANENTKDGTPSALPEKPVFVPDPAAPAPPNDEINSRTHRAAHARLVRRMEKLDAVQFPHMCKLWSGNRKDRNAKTIFFNELASSPVITYYKHLPNLFA